MPRIEAFAGLRYDLGHIGALCDVVAPPYDVIDPNMQDTLYKKHPANVVRLILNRQEQGDDDNENRYSRAGRFLRQWQREGVLFREHDPAIYVYHQVFENEGIALVRRGFMARCGLERFGKGNIYPHEETMPGPKADRLKLMRACQANLSQIFGLYPDPESEVQELLEAAKGEAIPIEATDHLGVVHRIWPITDVSVISHVTAAMGPQAMFIADGHHRYETACNYRDELAAAGELNASHPANGVLMMCVGMSDPGMIVQPTHRLFRGIAELTSEQLIERLGNCFATRLAGEGSDLAETIWLEIESENEQGTLGLYTAKDQRWTVARITSAGRQRMAAIAHDQSEDWRGLGVSILHRLIIDDLLDAAGHPRPGYVHRVSDLVEGLDQNSEPGGEGSISEPYQLAALVMPATVEHIRRVSEHGERMPAKSTYFYPKLLAGLVIHPLT
ncbi:MAG: DUF1015 domain-containing protein [Planctomycetota bacterium]|nr:DUF1015 domain-containing protein [Planctomycetota bacterium]